MVIWNSATQPSEKAAVLFEESIGKTVVVSGYRGFCEASFGYAESFGCAAFFGCEASFGESLPLRKMYYVYILKSLSTNKHYFGHTENLSQRLKTHNAGKVKYTKSFRPWRIYYTEEYPTRSEAYRRELFFKSKEGREWLNSKGIIYFTFRYGSIIPKFLTNFAQHL